MLEVTFITTWCGRLKVFMMIGLNCDVAEDEDDDVNQ
jgi:hypothetical protein